ncbi:hypothetical protein [Klebsiella oxytoca]|uniref:hypothetical protein n=1 Tax=Klebsiella oxytoca TaxID=571 RepID=UPI0007CC30FD|nr:hypothetical protein [Klebsiella oxytoca]MBZ7325083.1 hypothetical protein [Klebsiella oxytoca]MCW9543591.1 hypothetical protein [Klebsiella oxytoca]MCW9565136.1 hypothetical protein [Klebsiella oxytoca]MCW9575677.1 hypothetical protein [Klebsiella oxytoca]MCW9637059.1 hypothetical protein [Klebsiella oxytoca]
MSGVLASTAAAVGIIDKAVGIAKKLADDGGELDRATLKLELANLMAELASAKMEVITTQALLFDAEQKIIDLKEKLKDKAAFTFSDGVFWAEGDTTAFCPKCYENEDKKIHMVSRERAYAGFGSTIAKPNWYCRVCKTTFNRS